MDSTLFLVLFLGAFGLIVFTLLFGEGPSLRHGPVGIFNRFLTEKLPRAISWTLLHTVGQGNVNRLGRSWAYCCESRNPFLQIFFVLLSSVSIVLFLYNALPHIPGPYLHKIHYLFIPAQIISLYVVYYLACSADPGIITHENLEKHLDYYKYDGLIYKPKTCTTCKLQKPARSKHCSMCKACVGRLDHHCAWVNRCVGENNQRYFFLFLFTLVEFCAYGAYLCFEVYRGMIIEWGLDQALVHDTRTGEKSVVTFRRAFLYVLHIDRIIGAIGILAGVVSAVVFIFFVYQLYLAGRGITTNEAFKWEMIEESVDRGELFKIVPVKPTANTTALAEKNYTKRYNKKTKEEEHVEEKKIESFEEIENIYDKGFLGNLKEIFLPPNFN
ncbi:DHHC palmitoyltransferase-domain-containing protein [Mucor mucedo]|uniref:DHHC palmitoyltransferase-domain-containing protein n=1 Tax=Mucor mucedo TaxID=29922 RepID=UPI00221E4F40|nr:DHHC palmitoyltransferase-domain-containing protein [Mucor mucedo]KAI7893799.1 DHHC palmitoyltransferase-domain-containing protein [Mucor mucedo]